MTDGRPTGRVEGVHHVAFAHDAASPVLDAFREVLGLEVAHVEPGAGFVERMLPTGDGCHVQLLEACGPGVVDKFVERRGSALHHVALAVTGLDDLLAELQDRGVRLVDETPRPGGMGTRVAFIHPSVFGGLLVELVEQPGAP
jgi:methylmalonyl-CoA/ethylmalonyl-CoA epimerase